MFSHSSVHKALGLLALATLAATAPCDIYARHGTPCVAAHSTTRALYKAYNGALYLVVRNSDGTSTKISPLSAGGIADASAQDAFCANTTCVIQTIYDQSGRGNDLNPAPPGGAASGPTADGYDYPASAIGAPVTLHGQKAYGVFSSPGFGYRNDNTSGVATGNEPEGMYAIFDGTHYNDACCYDYGNAETDNHDDGAGTMEAIYFGNCTIWGSGAGKGPWIMADLEDGLFSGYSASLNSDDPTSSSRFVTAIVKGNSTGWSIRGGDAQSGSLATYYSGARPSGYVMDKQGAIILGIGGDNSNSAQGTFYEGVMTSGYPTDAAENAVQANIVAAKYAVTSLVSGPKVKVGSSVTFRVTTPGYDTRYIAHNGTNVVTEVITSSSSKALRKTGTWKVVTGLGNSGCVSFESADTPGSYIRHSDYELYIAPDDGSMLFADDSTFCPKAALNGQGNSILSWSYPTRWFRHYNNVLYIASEGGPEDFDATYSYNNDVSFVVSSGFMS